MKISLMMSSLKFVGQCYIFIESAPSLTSVQYYCKDGN